MAPSRYELASQSDGLGLCGVSEKKHIVEEPSRAFGVRLASTQPMNAHRRQAKQIAWGGVGARQNADLAELADWVEGLRAAAHTARVKGNLTLAEALDITRFEVYEGYLDEELDHQQSQAAARRSR
jgi:hypothetical protein